jgi:signal transduction histidine kinase
VDVYLTGQEYYTGHADQDPEINRGVVHTLGVRSLYAVPLRVDGTIAGLLVAESVHPDRFSPSERDFFEAVSRWVGMIAHRAQLHEELTRRAAEETRRAVAEEMLGTVAHDLSNLITPIKGQIDALKRRLERAGEERDTVQMAAISASLTRLNRMVQDLLDASRLEGGLFSLSRHPADLVDLVYGVVEPLKAERPEITVRAPEELVVSADAARLGQALQNLVGNAVQHTPDGVPVVVSVGQEQRDSTEWAVIEIRDDGPGIAADLLPRLFVRHATGGDRAGLGLGLYLARGIATAHGGELIVDSEVGTGTTFTLTLPIGDEERSD